jgi:hypothetical protein
VTLDFNRSYNGEHLKEDEKMEQEVPVGEMRSARISEGKPEGKRPLGRSRRRWKDNNKLDLKRNSMRGCELDSCDSRWFQKAGFCEYDNEPLDSIKSRGICRPAQKLVTFHE